jgi:hypothetical protein
MKASSWLTLRFRLIVQESRRVDLLALIRSGAVAQKLATTVQSIHLRLCSNLSI